MNLFSKKRWRFLYEGTFKNLPAIATLLVQSWQTLYASFLPESFLNGLNVHHQIRRHSKAMKAGTRYFVVEDGKNELLGFASFGPCRGESFPASMELYTIYVDEKAQKEGIGSLLLEHVMTEIHTRERTLAVLVMEMNPYRRFYEKQEFEFVGSEAMELGGTVLTNLIFRKDFGV